MIALVLFVFLLGVLAGIFIEDVFRLRSSGGD